MADDDRKVIVGVWSVRFKNWIWEYNFQPDGSVSWRDPLNGMSGNGRWAKQGNYINITWYDSTTKESFKCPLKPADQIGWYDAPYGIGQSKAKKLSTPPATAPTPTPVNPAIANLPWEKYVDQFTACKYDMNYKIPPDISFAYSNILQLTYSDGTYLELDFSSELKGTLLSSQQARDALAQGYLGRGGRIFPQVMAPATVPRLWSAREDALADQDADYGAFAAVAVAGVAWALSVPAMPAGIAPPVGTTVGKTRVPGVARNTGAAALGQSAKLGEEITEATVREAMRGAPLKSQQASVSLPIIRKYVQMLREGKAPPAIKVDEGIIVEGNHRYIAGRIFKRDPPIQQWAGGRPERVVSWDKIKIDTVEW